MLALPKKVVSLGAILNRKCGWGGAISRSAYVGNQTLAVFHTKKHSLFARRRMEERRAFVLLFFFCRNKSWVKGGPKERDSFLFFFFMHRLFSWAIVCIACLSFSLFFFVKLWPKKRLSPPSFIEAVFLALDAVCHGKG